MTENEDNLKVPEEAENIDAPVEKCWESIVNVFLGSTRTFVSDESNTYVSRNIPSVEEAPSEQESVHPSTPSSCSIDWGSESTWPDVDIPGTWGTQGLEKVPFEDSQKPCAQFLKYDELELDELESIGILTDRIIAASSSYLDRSPETGKYVCCKVDLSQKCLTNIKILTYHHYLQYVDISWNELTDVSALGQLPFLMYLDASHNFLDTVLDFKAPFNLTFVNYSHNDIHSIKNLADFWSIVHLDISNNRISTIEGLEDLKYLRHLNLSYNAISCIKNLNHMKLFTLLLQNNRITHFEDGPDLGLKTLTDIVWVNLKNNQFSTLSLFKEVVNIQSINMENNELDDLMELDHLKDLNFLTEAKFAGNPIYTQKHYMEMCLFNMKHLYMLDDDIVSASHKVLVDNSYRPSPHMKSVQIAARLLFMQQINDPILGSFIIPPDELVPPILIFVAPPGSRVKQMVKSFCLKYLKYTILGVSHTTRPKSLDEIEDKTYYFVSRQIFDEMVNKGEFISMTEVFGHKFGFAHTEISKTVGRSAVLILHTDLAGALTLRAKGYRCRLVLAMPSSEEVHKLWIAMKYYVHPPTSKYKSSRRIEHCPKKAMLLLPLTKYSQSSKAEILADQILEELMGIVVEDENADSSLCDDSVEDESEPNDDIGLRTHESGILKSPMHPKSPGMTPGKISVAFDNRSATVLHETDSRAHQNRVQSVRSVTFDMMIQSRKSAPTVSASEAVFKGHSADHGLLSVLSRADVDKEKHVKTNREIVASQLKALDIIIDEVMESRKTYLNVHLSSAGLFSEVVFTDNEKEALSKLKRLLEECIVTQTNMEPQYTLPTDNTYQTMIATRLSTLHRDIGSYLSVTQDQLDHMVRTATRKPLTSEVTVSEKMIVENMRKYHHQNISYKLPTTRPPASRKKSSINSDDFF